MISVRQLVHRYRGKTAVDGVSLDVAPGELLAILGPNGSGKTTLFRVLSTLIPPQSGQVSFGNLKLPKDVAQIRRQLGVVFQHPSLDKKLTVAENIRCHGVLYGLVGALLERRLTEATQSLGIADRLNDRVEKLSGGLKRRVELAKSLIHRPSILLLDEPSTGLDPAARMDLWNYLSRLRRELAITLVFTTHLLDEADNTDRVAILNAGKLVCLDEPAKLRAAIGGECLSIQSEDPQALLNALKQQYDWKMSLIDQIVRIEAASAHDLVPELMRRFGSSIQSLTLGRPTLEDVFVKHTGHKFWHESSPLSAKAGKGKN